MRDRAGRRLHLLILAATGWSLPAGAAVLPDCAGGVEIARAQVVRVEQNGVMVLADGRALSLEGIRLPMGESDHAPKFFADQAQAALLTLAREKPVTATAVAPKQDRYDRVRVQAFAEVWLQRALLEQGLARVSIAPDRDECAPDLYAFEAAARRAGRGIWASPAYRIRTERDDWRPDIGTFQVIEGRAGRVSVRDDRIAIEFGADGRSGLSVVIAGDDRAAFRRADFALGALQGKHLRLRGLIRNVDGRPQIALSNPAQIEILD